MTAPVRTTACRSCRAPIRWAKSARSGTSMPLDAEPAADGNVRVNEAGVATVMEAAEAEAWRAAGREAFTAHFASCPQAGEWRRR